MAVNAKRELELLEKLDAGVSPQEELRILEELDSGKSQRRGFPRTDLPATAAQTAMDFLRAPTEEGPPVGESASIGLGRGFVDILEGAGSLGLDVAGMVSPSMAERANQFALRRRAEAEEFSQTPVGQTTPAAVGRFAGNVVPFAPIPAGGATLGSQALRGGATGAGVGVVSGIPPGETPGQRMVGRVRQAAPMAAIGAALPFGIVGARMARHPIAALTRRAVTSPLFERSNEVLGRLGFKGTIGQRAGDLAILAAEGQAKAGSAQGVKQFLNQTARNARKRFESVARQYSPKDLSDAKVGRAIFKAGRDAVDDMLKVRRAQATVDFANVEALAGRGKIMSVPNTIQQLQKWSARATAGSRTALKATTRQLNDLLKKADDGKVSAEFMEQMLSDYSRMSAGKGHLMRDITDNALRREIGRDIIQALEKDLNVSAARFGQARTNKVAQAIRTARDNYKRLSKPINDLEQSAFGKLIDKDEATPFEVIKQMRTWMKKGQTNDPEKVRQVMRFMDDWDESLANRARAWHINRAIKEATETKPSDPTGLLKFDADKMWNELGTEETIQALFPRKAQRQLLNDAVEALKIIGSRGTNVGGGRAIGTTIEQAAATVPKLDPTFVALNAARIVNPWAFRRALLTDQGQRKLIQIGRGLRNPSKYQSGAIAAINDITKEFTEDMFNGNEVQQ